MIGQSEHLSDNEYVTQAQLDERMQEMQIYGDGTTTMVDKQSGGTTISCTIPVGDAGGDEVEPIFTTYADGNDGVVAWRDFQVMTWAAGITEMKLFPVDAGEFKFTGASGTIWIMASNAQTSGGGRRLYWYGSSSGADAFTIESEHAAGGKRLGPDIQLFIGQGNGKFNKEWDDDINPVVDYAYFYSEGTRTIYVPLHYNAFPAVESIALPVSTNDQLYWYGQNGSLATTLDFGSSSTSYNGVSIEIGDVLTDANGILQTANVPYAWVAAGRPSGWTGTFTEHTGKTVTVVDGIIKSVI